MKKIFYILIGMIAMMIFGFAFVAQATPVTVPSAPSSGYALVSTTTGNYIATTTDPFHAGSYFATSTATSTFNGGLNVTSGCISILSVCIGSGTGSGTVNSGTTGQDAFYASNGTAVSATSTIFISPASLVGISTTFPSAILDILSVSNNNTPLFNIASSTNGTGTTSAVYIAPNGQIGINALPTSSAQLTIFSPSVVATGGQPTLQIGSAITSGTVGSGPDLLFGNGTTINGNFKIQDGADAIGGGDTNLIFSGGGNNTPTEVFRMKYNGQIGISTSTPWGTFAINPTAANSGGGGPEFVVGSSTQTSFVVAANNDVGVGISTPTNTLSLFTVGSTAAASPTILFAASTTGAFSNHWIIGVDNSFAGDFVVASSSGTIGTNRTLVVDGNRSVGVGQVTASTLPDTLTVYPSLISTTLGAEMELDGNGTVPPTTLGNFGGNMTLGTNMRARNVGGTGFVSVLNGPTTVITTVSSTGQMNFDFASTSAGTTISATNLTHFTLGLNTGAGLSTTTPYGGLDIATSTRPQLYLEDGLGTFGGYAFRSVGGYLYIGTTTQAEATSTPVEFTLASNGNVGIASSTPNSILSIGSGNGINFTSATSSFYTTGGLNLVSGGCYAIAGTCVGGAVASTNYWTLNGNNIYNNNNSGNGFVGIGTSSPFATLSLNNPLTAPSVSFWGMIATSSLVTTVSTFTSNGNWTVPSNLVSVSVTVIGGGGGGGQQNSVNQGGGGGGSSAFGSLIVADGGGGGCTSGTSVCNGAHGAGGAPGTATSGGAGASGSANALSGGGGAAQVASSSIAFQQLPSVGGNVPIVIGIGGQSGTSGGASAGGAGFFAGGNTSQHTGGGGGGSTGAGSVGGASTGGSGGLGGSFGGTVTPGVAGNGDDGSGGASGSGAAGGALNTGGSFPGGGSGGIGNSGGQASVGANGEVIVTAVISLYGTTTTPTLGIFNASTTFSGVTTSNPYLGFGTTSPLGTLTISSASSTPNTVLQGIVNGIAYIFKEVDQWGHMLTGGSAPTCGTGCNAVQGDDSTFRVTTGTGVTAVTVNFSHAYSVTPVCVSSDESGGTTVSDASSTPSSVTMNLSASLTTKSIGVICQASMNFTY